MELKFKRDTSFRKQFFVPDSFAHPAKMDAQLLIWIVEHYTKPGEVILDPMAGSGTTMLACTLGRDVVLVEIEEKFCNMCKSNWEKVSAMPQLGYEMGQCNIVQGDARQLEGLVDKIVTSPPHGDSLSAKRKGYTELESLADTRQYPENPNNLGNLPYGRIDKIVTSPPFAGQSGGKGEASSTPINAKYPGLFERHLGGNKGGLSDNPQQIDNLPYGNLKSESYLEAMLQVYQQCHEILRPQGLMILVTKNFIRNKQVVRLDEDTIKLCKQAGFRFVERHYRKLPAQSFWRIIYHQRHPDVEQIKSEDILVMKRSGAER